MPWQSKWSPAELEQMRIAYQSDEESAVDIAERFGTTAMYLRNLAHVYGWKRPRSIYRKGVEPKVIPPEKWKSAKAMWDTLTPTAVIARWINVSENTAFKLCTREFGSRNLRMIASTHATRRNHQLLKLRLSGATLAELAQAYQISEKSVSAITSRMAKAQGHKVPECFTGRKKRLTLDEAKRRLIDEQFEEELMLHESFCADLVKLVARNFKVTTRSLMEAHRGKTPAAIARGVVMYLLHVECGLTMRRVGYLMGRHRTTVRHHSHKQEDLRDDPSYDQKIQAIADKFVEGLKERRHFVSPYELYFRA